SQFPADFISEAVDQTRDWFYSLLAISTLIFNKAPYKNVIVLGHVQDENGQKMSKSKGNAVDPFDALQSYGADAIRWYFYTNSAPWLPNRFHGKAVVEGQRKFMSTLWNTYAFYVLYANIDSFDPTKYNLDDCKLTVMDKWLLSKLNSMVKTVDDNLANYRIPEAAKALQEFTDEMSNWYVRRGRERYWVQGITEDKVAAYMTLYTALVTTAKTAAPMVPFMAEAIYRNLVCNVDKSAPESVHLCFYPEVREDLIDLELEKNMDEVVSIVVLGRAARNGSNIKNRQPLNTMYVQCDKKVEGYFVDIIREELNIKNVDFVEDASSFVSYVFKPQLKTVGPKYGKQLGEIREALANLESSAKATLDAEGKIVLSLASGEVELLTEDILLETKQKEGVFTVSDRGVTVALDTELTPELIEEGFVKELISKIQTMRKDSDFNVMDRINVTLTGNDKLFEIAKNNESAISTVVLANSIENGEKGQLSKEWDINGETVTITVERV
ncbi:MAG: class I tRNA ligase family protein, partial [Clostridia bacterium]|nr:class I tRNA ligase family protein [Clostridia bacterium]